VAGVDPPLSEAGHARARALDEALHAAEVSSVIISQYARTRQTAAPLLARLQMEPEIVEAGADGHVDAVAAAVRAADGVVLVVGHSNTVMRIIAALGGPAADDLDESEYSWLFVLQPDGERARLLRARYGAL
jgi:phosphohistidine phosphatase SixA